MVASNTSAMHRDARRSDGIILTPRIGSDQDQDALVLATLPCPPRGGIWWEIGCSQRRQGLDSQKTFETVCRLDHSTLKSEPAQPLNITLVSIPSEYQPS